MKIKNIFLPLIILISVSPFAFAEQAATDSQLNSISVLGKLNGIALQCDYRTQMQQIKQALVVNLPKKRALGEWFETKTNDSFMSFMSSKETCPSAVEFMQKVNAAIINLETEFKK